MRASVAESVERVLLVDESADLIAALTDLLIDIGYVVVGAQDRATALALVRSFRPSTIVVDPRLPGLKVADLTQQVRELAPSPRLIALTADGSPSSRQRATTAGIGDFLVKPVGIRKLVAVLERGRRLRAAALGTPAPTPGVRRRRQDRAGQYTSERYRVLQLALADNVRRLRHARGWTQEDAARRCVMAPRLLQRVEAATLNATMTTLARLCEGFGVEATILLARAPTPIAGGAPDPTSVVRLRR